MAAQASRFRLASKNLFLTYPQCDYQLESFLNNCKDLFKEENIIRMVVARELHEDGNPHIHAVISLGKEFRTRDERMFDDLVEPSKHPNIISRIKSMHATYKYVTKDGNFIVHPSDFDVKMFIELAEKKKSTRVEEVVRMIKDGITMKEIDEEMPTFVFTHRKKIEEYIELQATFTRQSERVASLSLKLNVRVDPLYSTSALKFLAKWLNKSVRQNIQRRHKQLWFVASAGAGKTETIRMLEEHYKLSIYRPPLDEEWFDDYQDGIYDLILFDEYKHQKKIQTLNRLLSNDITPLSRRGKSPVVKHDTLPVLILSNYTPAQAYSKASVGGTNPGYLALIDRIVVKQMEEGEKVRLIIQPEDVISDEEIHPFFNQ